VVSPTFATGRRFGHFFGFFGPESRINKGSDLIKEVISKECLVKTYSLHGEKNFSKIGGHVFAKRKFIERRKESLVHRKEQSLERLTQKRKEIIARKPRWSRR
jgi:hypothetical protein